MIKSLLALLVLSAATLAEANCGVTLSAGTMRATGVPTARVDSQLTTRYTGVRTLVKSRSTVYEESLECEVGYGFAIALSGIQGLHISVDREVYFSGVQYHGFSLGQVDLFSVKEDVTARALRLSLVKTFDTGIVSPYLRIGVEQVKALHIASTPIPYTDREGDKPLAISYAKPYNKTAPYVGLGLSMGKKDWPITARIEYQYLSPPPHKLDVLMFGVMARFAF